MVSVYIHFPYCLYKCHYCDFNSYAIEPSDGLFDRYLEGLKRELDFRLNHQMAFAAGSSLSTLFIGGGTPSLLSPLQLEGLFRFMVEVYPVSKETEITIECNPKTLSREKLAAYRELGVNRLSIGIQSFEDRFLAPLGRIHTGEEAREALQLAKESGIPSLNLDLIFGFPGQTTGDMLADLETADSFQFPHLSLYNLTLEPGTKLSAQERRGEVVLPSADVSSDWMGVALEFLESRGFNRYEISNFHRKGESPSRHNVGYWEYAPFLGLGAGAASFFHESKGDGSFGARHMNERLPDRYLQGIAGGRFFEEERIDRETAIREFIMMGLRQVKGISLADFTRLFPGESFEARFGRVISRLEARGLLFPETLQKGTLHATSKGLMLLSSLTAEFF